MNEHTTPAALVVGYGSIGTRHSRVLGQLGCEISVVTSRADCPLPRFASLPEALGSRPFAYVVISNRTGEHLETLNALAETGFRGDVLVEKPIFAAPASIPLHKFRGLYVGYNLRHHPLVGELRAQLNSRRVLSAHVYVGQYLPDWRPGLDYRQSYSAHREQGGGVLRDLSHELDMLVWLFGDWRALAARSARVSGLEISTEDVVGVIGESAECPLLTLQMNYLDRAKRREMIVNCADASFRLDFIAGTLTGNGVTRAAAVNPDDTYRALHQAVLSRDTSCLCSGEEGLRTVRLIQAIESASQGNRWEKV